MCDFGNCRKDTSTVLRMRNTGEDTRGFHLCREHADRLEEFIFSGCDYPSLSATETDYFPEYSEAAHHHHNYHRSVDGKYEYCGGCGKARVRA